MRVVGFIGKLAARNRVNEASSIFYLMTETRFPVQDFSNVFLELFFFVKQIGEVLMMQSLQCLMEVMSTG
jgi:hypothetical protein